MTSDNQQSSSNDADKGIVSPHDHDVLSGRGNFVNYHAGNEHFRALVRKHKMDYVQCPKPQKGKFSRLIVDEIQRRDPPGRFLKQDATTKLWHDIGEKKALDKTRQALREGAPDIMKEISGEETDQAPSAGGATSSGDNNRASNTTGVACGAFGMLPEDSFNPIGLSGPMPGDSMNMGRNQMGNMQQQFMINDGVQLPQQPQQIPQQILTQQSMAMIQNPNLSSAGVATPEMLQQLQAQLQQQQQQMHNNITPVPIDHFHSHQLGNLSYGLQQNDLPQRYQHQNHQQNLQSNHQQNMMMQMNKLDSIGRPMAQQAISQVSHPPDNQAPQQITDNGHSIPSSLENNRFIVDGGTLDAEAMQNRISSMFPNAQQQLEPRPIDTGTGGGKQSLGMKGSASIPPPPPEDDGVPPPPSTSAQLSGRRNQPQHQAGLKRDDSLRFDKIFMSGQTPPTASMGRKKSDGNYSSAHMSAMSLSIGDMMDAGNLSSVFDNSLRISTSGTDEQASSKEGSSFAISKGPKRKQHQQQQQDSSAWEVQSTFDMSVATLGDETRHNMSFATLADKSESNLSFSQVFEDPDKGI